MAFQRTRSSHSYNAKMAAPSAPTDLTANHLRQQRRPSLQLLPSDHADTESILSPTFTGSAARHRHAEKSDTALQRLLALFADDPDSPDTHWRPAGERGGTRISTHDTHCGSGGMLPMVRGDGVLEGGFAPREVIAVINSFGARKFWDSRFDGGKLVQIYNQTEWLAHIALKGTFPLINRDVVVATQFYRDERTGFLCYSSTSVDDPLTPQDPQRVRCNLDTAGWVIRPDPNCPSGDRLLLTYIVQVDVGGQVPLSIARMLLRDLPTCVAGITRYMRRYTFPPHLVPQLSPPRRHSLAKPLPEKSPRRPSLRPPNGVRVLHEAFEHRLSTFDLAYRVEFGQGPLTPGSMNRSHDLVTAEVRLPRPIFPNGVSVDVRPANRVAWQLIDERTGRVVDEGGDASEAVIAAACDRLAQIALIEEEEGDAEKASDSDSRHVASMIAIMQPPSPTSPAVSLRRYTSTSNDDRMSEDSGYFAHMPTIGSPGRAVPPSVCVPSSAFGRVVTRRRVSNSSEDSWDENGMRRLGMTAVMPAGLQTPMSRRPSRTNLPSMASLSSTSFQLPPPFEQPPYTPAQSTSAVSTTSSSSSSTPAVVGQVGVRGLSRSNSTSSSSPSTTRRCLSPMPVVDAHQGYETRHPGWRLVIYNDTRVNGRVVQVCIKKHQPAKQRRFGANAWAWMQRD
ncbi:hypothetical protein THASP1DRAFT_32596 [Thamnocephalis sphaerospora]|uniref:START domain-containing protein n=1 Tax=Thamnocephalis sphaerospora TaxID=78915 RepID=A0A4P9XIM7_9FUNG|nr:hypothetical protein THASP1DRAFT_32596 [Thamnocephalis sphaerospora]|eukprot:RKP05564.1 hypothetical protein THASP1DRAFT_32596 [Thamnocephalis sphaerospora]